MSHDARPGRLAAALTIHTPSQIIVRPSGTPYGASKARKPTTPLTVIARQRARGNTPARRLARPNSAHPAANDR